MTEYYLTYYKFGASAVVEQTITCTEADALKLIADLEAQGFKVCAIAGD